MQSSGREEKQLLNAIMSLQLIQELMRTLALGTKWGHLWAVPTYTPFQSSTIGCYDRLETSRPRVVLFFLLLLVYFIYKEDN